MSGYQGRTAPSSGCSHQGDLAVGIVRNASLNPGIDPRGPRTETLLFPAFLRLADRKAVVVGGGPVATSKVPALLAAGARVTIVAPRQVADLDALPVRQVRRDFRASDLDGAWWVVAAATPAVNRRVRRAADRRRVFINAVDDVANATACLGAVLRRGEVAVAISTGGDAPALAVVLRDALEALLPGEVAAWVDLARAERARWKADGVPLPARKSRLLAALAAIAGRDVR